MGRWAGRDVLVADEVDERRWEDGAPTVYGGRLIIDTQTDTAYKVGWDKRAQLAPSHNNRQSEVSRVRLPAKSRCRRNVFLYLRHLPAAPHTHAGTWPKMPPTS